MRPIRAGMLRVKNEGRWLARVLQALAPVCEEVYVLDDSSTDDSVAIARGLGCKVFESPFDTFAEARDKTYLLQKIWEDGAQIGESVICQDGDEILMQQDLPALLAAIHNPRTVSGSFQIKYAWNREDQIRVDGCYRNFCRPSYFSLTSRDLTFYRSLHGGELHCSSVPAQLIPFTQPLAVRVLHLGYLHKEDRIRKYHFYRSIDPGATIEDEYRHIAMGDLPELPAEARFVHAGPLRLEPLHAS